MSSDTVGATVHLSLKVLNVVLLLHELLRVRLTYTPDTCRLSCRFYLSLRFNERKEIGTGSISVNY